MLLPKTKIIRDRKYRLWLSTLPCCITGVSGQTQVSHVKRLGMGLKSSDDRCVPLSIEKHSEQHSMGNEDKFWAKYGKTIEQVDELCNALWFRQYQDDSILLLTRFRKGIINA